MKKHRPPIWFPGMGETVWCAEWHRAGTIDDIVPILAPAHAAALGFVYVVKLGTPATIPGSNRGAVWRIAYIAPQHTIPAGLISTRWTGTVDLLANEDGSEPPPVED